MKSLASDNYSPVSPEIFEYLTNVVNQGHAKAYSLDETTQEAETVVKEIFNIPNADVHFTLTGTGANILSARQALKPIHSLLVAKSSHLNTNESGSPESLAGIKLIQSPHYNGKIKIDDLENIVLQELDNLPHAPRPKMLSIAQSTEYGTVYSLEELRAIREFCDTYKLFLHLDLCRVYNAAIALNCRLQDIVAAAKPDIFSLGGTKNGLMMAEAVVIINTNLKEDFVILQKQSMQLYSKMRYLSGQFIPYFKGNLWSRNARQANEMCSYLYEQLKEIPEVKITIPVQTNHIFCILPKNSIEPLQKVSFFYIWDLAQSEVRFVTSWDTTRDDIDNFVKELKSLLNK